MSEQISQPALNKHRQNGFDLLRLVAAALVIYGHSFPLTRTSPPGYLGSAIQTIAVKIFFVISGFLITQSWISDPNILRYAQRRALRIFPALILICLVTVLLLGPILTSFTSAQYFTSGQTWRYLYNIFLYPTYGLPGVFAQNTYPGAVNGSLWTLPVEVAMYVSVPILIGSKPDSARLILPVTAILYIVCGVYYGQIHHPARTVVYGTNLTDALDVSVYFLIGAVYSFWNLSKFRRPLLSIILLLFPSLFNYDTLIGELCLLFFLPFAVISIGSMHFVFAERVVSKQDLSYGLYLYGFLVQQTLAAIFRNQLGPGLNCLLALMVSGVLAYISWHLVEKRALAYKPIRPRKSLTDTF